ncbi:MAG: sulfotransferase [Pseudomonadota bacterium]
MITHYAVYGLCLVVTAELLIRLPLFRTSSRIRALVTRVMSLITNDAISDHWKELVVPHYAGKIIFASLSVMFWTIAAFSPFIGLIVADELGLTPGIGEGLMTWPVLLGLTLGGVAYAVVRSRLGAPAAAKPKNSDYSPTEQLLHDVILADQTRGQYLFGIERRMAKVDAESMREHAPVFVSGLARAGTTSLMRAIYQSGAFTSLTYRDMPFVLAPNLWRRLNKNQKKEMDAKERAHGDSILVDFDSPEALEEPFWLAFSKQQYVKIDRLVPYQPDADIVDKYRSFVGHAIKDAPGKRYLAKNNNNILRLPSLGQAFPNATVLIPFRDPVAQASSLLNQHLRFTEDTDDFTPRYMTYLGHYEFGPRHKAFALNGHIPKDDPQTLDYWLHQWVTVYEYLLEQSQQLTAPPQFVSYERLCAEGSDYWDSIARRIDVPTGAKPDFRLSPRQSDRDGEISDALLERARKIYAELDHASTNTL